MKLAWICYDYVEDGEDLPEPVILFTEPDLYRFRIIIPIVYAKIESGKMAP